MGMIRKFKIPAIGLFFLIAIIGFMSCTTSSNDNGTSGNDGQASFRIGMITDEGGIGDKSFNDSVYRGLSRAEKDFSAQLQVLEPKQDSEFESYIDRISRNSDLVVAVGYKLKDSVEKASAINPGVNYILIDDEVQGDNVHNLRFKEEEGSFLAGVLAGLMTKTNRIGFIGGVDSTLVRKFEAGFVAGVKSVNEEAGRYLEDGTTSRYAGTFSDVSKGYEISKSLYDGGVDIIYHAAGGVGIGVFRAADETGNYAIGVDDDQASSIPEYSHVIITSVVKNLGDGVYNIVKDTLDRGFTPGVTELGLKEGGLYLPKNEKFEVSQDILDVVAEYEKKIISGEIVVPKVIG